MKWEALILFPSMGGSSILAVQSPRASLKTDPSPCPRRLTMFAPVVYA